jgi:hypothetical protein
MGSGWPSGTGWGATTVPAGDGASGVAGTGVDTSVAGAGASTWTGWFTTGCTATDRTWASAEGDPCAIVSRSASAPAPPNDIDDANFMTLSSQAIAIPEPARWTTRTTPSDCNLLFWLNVTGKIRVR